MVPKKSITGYKNMWHYLEEHGFIGNGPELLNKGKKEYQRLYKRKHKQLSRIQKKEVSVIFPSEENLEQFRKWAKQQNLPLSTFLRETSSAYMEQRFVQVEKLTSEKINQNLHLIDLHLQKLIELLEDNNSDRFQIEYTLNQFSHLQSDIEQLIDRPQLLKSYLAQLIEQEPWQREMLIRFLTHSEC